MREVPLVELEGRMHKKMVPIPSLSASEIESGITDNKVKITREEDEFFSKALQDHPLTWLEGQMSKKGCHSFSGCLGLSPKVAAMVTTQKES